MRIVSGLLAATLALVLTACGGGAAYEVTSSVISDDEFTQSITVWAPDEEGPWPVVYAMPGSGGEAARDLEVVATELAKRGVVVFGTDLRTEPLVPEQVEQDSECGYRYARQVAAEYGGDLTEPVTMFGFSLGASGAVVHGLDTRYGQDGDYSVCYQSEARPDVVVSVAGCLEQLPENWLASLDSSDADVVLVTGSEDTVCPTGQSEYAQAILEPNGFAVTMHEVPDADHGELVFHDLDNDWAELPRDDPSGQTTVTVVLDAIQAAQ